MVGVKRCNEFNATISLAIEEKNKNWNRGKKCMIHCPHYLKKCKNCNITFYGQDSDDYVNHEQDLCCDYPSQKNRGHRARAKENYDEKKTLRKEAKIIQDLISDSTNLPECISRMITELIIGES